MIRVVSIVTLCSFLAACQSTPGVSQRPVLELPRLALVKTIYIENLGKERDADLIEGSNLVREEISTELARSGVFLSSNHRKRLMRSSLGWQVSRNGTMGWKGFMDWREILILISWE